MTKEGGVKHSIAHFAHAPHHQEDATWVYPHAPSQGYNLKNIHPGIYVLAHSLASSGLVWMLPFGLLGCHCSA